MARSRKNDGKRRDPDGRALNKGETYKKDQKLYRYTYTDTFGKRHDIYDRDLHVLREKVEQVERDRLDGVGTYVQGKASIDQVFDRYIKTKTAVAESTLDGYYDVYERYVKDSLGKRKVGEIVYSDVLIFYQTLIDRGLKINTVGNVDSVLHPMFQMAVRDRIIRVNPSDGVLTMIKKGKKGHGEERHPLSREETRAFLDWLERPENLEWKCLFTVMFGTGMRIGELIGLRWSDVDLEKGEIYVNHSVSYRKDRKQNRCMFKVSQPKTAAGFRTIPIIAKVREVLLAEKELQESDQNLCTSEVGGMSGFIFSNRFGMLHKPGSINKAIKRIVRDYNANEVLAAKREGREPLLVPAFSCHIARHTFCSRLCEVQPNIKIIQQIMGHKDIQTTLNIYAEVAENIKRQGIIEIEDDLL